MWSHAEDKYERRFTVNLDIRFVYQNNVMQWQKLRVLKPV